MNTTPEKTTITRDVVDLEGQTGNLYESIAIMSKRANQIQVNTKEELNQKLSEFASHTDNLEEVFENREQIEMSRHYERLPKAPAVAIHEFLDGKITFRRPAKPE
jgi:DNA-directed RNA polymerase subunit K/omega